MKFNTKLHTFALEKREEIKLLSYDELKTMPENGVVFRENNYAIEIAVESYKNNFLKIRVEVEYNKIWGWFCGSVLYFAKNPEGIIINGEEDEGMIF